MAQKRIGCFTSFLIIIGVIWIIFQISKPPSSPPPATSPKESSVQKTDKKGQEKPKRVSYDWKTLANNLIKDYQGKIVSIEQLNSTTCWADLSNAQAVKIAENIGYYIRNSTGGIHGETPSVHVFLRGEHVAVARPSGVNYYGKIKIENWHALDFGGKYRP